MKEVYESLIDKNSIKILIQLINSKLISINGVGTDEIFVNMEIVTDIKKIEIIPGVIKFAYDECSTLKIIEETNHNSWINGNKVYQIFKENKTIKNIYIVRDIIETKAVDSFPESIEKKDIGIVFELETYNIGWFVSDFRSYTVEKLEFDNSVSINDINILEGEQFYKEDYEERLESFKREKVYIKELM